MASTPARAAYGGGSIELRSGKWRVRWSKTVMVGGKPRRRSGRSRPFATREAAEEFRALGLPTPAFDSSSLTWDAWLDIWLSGKLAELALYDQDSYADSLRGIVENHLRPRIGSFVVATTTKKDLDDLWFNLLSPDDGGKAPATVRNIRGALSLAAKAAKEDGHLMVDVVSQSSLPRSVRNNDADRRALKELKILAPASIEWVAQAAIDRLFGAWSLPTLIALDTGLRRGEVLGLQWGDHQPDQGTHGQLKVKRQVLDKKNGKPRRLGRPKSEASRRAVSISKRLAEALTAARPAGASDSNQMFPSDHPSGRDCRVIW